MDAGTYQFGMTNIGNEEQCLSVNHDQRLLGTYSMIRISIPTGSADMIDVEQPSKYFYSEVKGIKTNQDTFFTATICHPSACLALDVSKVVDIYFGHRVDYTIKSTNRSLKSSSIARIQKMSMACIFSLIAFTISSTLKYNTFKSIPLGSCHFDVIANIHSVIR